MKKEEEEKGEKEAKVAQHELLSPSSLPDVQTLVHPLLHLLLHIFHHLILSFSYFFSSTYFHPPSLLLLFYIVFFSFLNCDFPICLPPTSMQCSLHFSSSLSSFSLFLLPSDSLPPHSSHYPALPDMPI